MAGAKYENLSLWTIVARVGYWKGAIFRTEIPFSLSNYSQIKILRDNFLPFPFVPFARLLFTCCVLNHTTYWEDSRIIDSTRSAIFPFFINAITGEKK